jgi:hypothetical protein
MTAAISRPPSPTRRGRDEDPGRILHEMRYGELTAFEERPHSPYYGSADATPLFVVLLDEYERWTGDTRLVRELELEARAALRWIDEYADLQGNGYIAYQRRNQETGLENQCWKDSWDSISYHDGTLPGFPRATCELQGYAYDAKLRGARLARLAWRDPGFAEALERQAADLKRRFNRDFWVEDGEYFAIALDADGRQVDSLASNNGHLLWSGIVDKAKAKAVVRHLMGERLFSGWGVRTLAVGEGRYNPIGYHVGTIWPFDNSFIAWGLRRYGFKEEAAQVAAGILEAAEFFDGRLPEAFGGYPRSMTKYPVRYPTACSPQAWSTGAPLLLLSTMLGLEPVGEHLGGRLGTAQHHWVSGTARHPRSLGPCRCLRPRPRRHLRPGAGTARALATARQLGQPDRSNIIEGQGRQRSPAAHPAPDARGRRSPRARPPPPAHPRRRSARRRTDGSPRRVGTPLPATRRPWSSRASARSPRVRRSRLPGSGWACSRWRNSTASGSRARSAPSSRGRISAITGHQPISRMASRRTG